MKKNHPFFYWFLFVLTFLSCKKEIHQSDSVTDNSIIEQARTYFRQTYPANSSNNVSGDQRLTTNKAPDWEKAKIIKMTIGNGVLVPVQYAKNTFVVNNFGGSKLQSLSALTKLLIYRDSKAVYHFELITTMPDTIINPFNNQQFSGIIRVEDWNGSLLNQYKFKNGTVMKFDITKVSKTVKSLPGPLSIDKVVPTLSELEVDYYLEGYNYEEGNPGGGYAWSEYVGTATYYFPDTPDTGGGNPSGADYGNVGNDATGVTGGGSGSPGSSGPSSTDFTVASGTNIIANISDYVKCFSNYGGNDHSYQVQVCVDQPVPGSRSPWAWTSGGPAGSSAAGNPVNVGHAFLVLSEIFNDHAIVRNIGFYPQTMVAPWSTADQGQLNNDAGHDYNISITMNVTNAQFFEMLNYVSQANNPGYKYDLNSNNCTTFALNALSAGGVSLPSTIGTWVDGGNGNNPGDLGEDIRSMQLSSGMSVNTNFQSHPNQGNCN